MTEKLSLKTLKENRRLSDGEFAMDIFSEKTVQGFLATCMESDFNRVIATVDQILDIMGFDTSLGDKLVEEMDNLSETITQCYESFVVNEMLDRGFIYLNGVFSNGKIEVAFKDIMYKEIDQSLAMAKQLKEIKDLKEKK